MPACAINFESVLPRWTLVEIAHNSGALGARLTGAGFGGCVVILCKTSDSERIQADLVKSYYSHHANFDPENHIIIAEPSSGAALA
jgi:galactokinase